MGNWWWYNDKGAINYQNNYYKVSIDEWGGYNLILKGNPKDYTLLYQVGNCWKTVNWKEKGKEQY